MFPTAAKPTKTLEFRYPMILEFLIIFDRLPEIGGPTRKIDELTSKIAKNKALLPVSINFRLTES